MKESRAETLDAFSFRRTVFHPINFSAEFVRTSLPPDIIYKLSSVFSLAIASAERRPTQIRRAALLLFQRDFRRAPGYRPGLTPSDIPGRAKSTTIRGESERRRKREGKKLEKRQKYQSACVHNHS